jgi:hypothetical protein
VTLSLAVEIGPSARLDEDGSSTNLMTCLYGYFNDPALDSLGEALLKAVKEEAVAVWASSGMTVANEQVVRLMFAGSGNPLFGEVMRRAQQTISDSNIQRT